MGEFGKNMLGSLASGLGRGVAGMGLGLIGGLFGGIKAKKQHKRNKELLQMQNQMEIERMGLQANLNKEQAKYSQELAQQMYDYTFQNEAEYNDPANQRKRMEAAGLNPALMYGGSSAGAGGVAEGTTAGAGSAGPVTALQPMGLQIALQNEMQKAQIDAMRAQTLKTNAEAAAVGANIEKTGTEINLNKITAAKTGEEIKSIAAEVANKAEQLRGQILENDILDETKEFKINQAAEEYRQMVMKTQEILVNSELNVKEKEMLQKEIDGFERKLQALEKQAEASEDSAEAAIQSAKAAYKSAEALETQADTAKDKSTSEKAKNWSSTIDGVIKAGGVVIDLILLKRLKAAGFTLKGAYKVLQKMRGGA